MRVVLLGLPASGKGTQARLIAQRFGSVFIGAGDMLREHVETGTDLGKKVAPYLAEGAFPPHHLVSKIVCRALEGKDAFVLDGFPRVVEQAEALEHYLEKVGQDLTLVFYLKLSRSLAAERLTSRRVCLSCKASLVSTQKNTCSFCGGSDFLQRADDTSTIVEKRLEVQEIKLFPLLEYYEKQGMLATLNAASSELDVFEEILVLLKQRQGFSQR